MPFGLLKYGLTKKHPGKHHFTPTQDLKKRYDVVIIGAGGHGTAIAYNLAKYHGITNIAVLDKGYLGGGNTARNTAVIRSNYLTEEGVSFYKESVAMYQNLSNEFGYNVMMENRGQLTLAHSDATIRSFRWRAEVNQHLGVRSELIDRKTIRELVPNLRMDDDSRFPILGGLWHADGATARHDAVAWGYAKGACERGVELHQRTEVHGFDIKAGKVFGVKTNRGDIE